jgi:hypothetical protein
MPIPNARYTGLMRYLRILQRDDQKRKSPP